MDLAPESPRFDHEQRESPRNAWPEEARDSWGSGFLGRWTYSYMNSLFAKGSRQHKDGVHLTQADLFSLPHSMQSEVLSDLYNSLLATKSNKSEVGPILWKIAAPTFVPAGFCSLVTIFAQSSMPLVVRGLLNVLEEHPSEAVMREGLPFAFGLFAIFLVNGLAYQRQRHLAIKTGVLIRNAMLNVLYDHLLNLTPRGRSGLTSGEVTTLIAVDTQKLFEVTQDGHLVWGLPLSICIITTLLVVSLGPVTLVGVFILIAFVPVAFSAHSAMMKIRTKRTLYTDQRVDISSSMLQGIRVAKLNNYENNYLEKLSKVRQKEVSLLGHELFVWATTLTMTVISPIVATSATFAIYILIDEDHTLTAARTFSVLLLFSALRFPINLSGKLLGKAAQAASALQRIEAFLSREVRTDKGKSNLSKMDVDELLLRLEDAAFKLDQPDSSPSEADAAPSPDSSFVVSGFNFSVSKGQVVAVSGPVGAGKSTLINGILGEVALAKDSSDVSIRGKVSYAPQTPFIQNTTLRENILFGLPFEKDLYEKVIDACCLRSDIERLGKAKDLTEIGERGVTLSGGQKQRVSLARAAYAQSDLVLLDDPLSALDAETAKMVFENLIKGENALLQNCGVLLVTHAAHYLSLVDLVVLVVDGECKFQGDWTALTKFEPADANTRTAVDHIRSSLQEDLASNDEGGNAKQESGDMKSTTKDVLMTVETREHGLSSWKTWSLWFKYAGGTFFMSILIFAMALDRFMYIAVEYWIAFWTGGVDESMEILGITFEPQTNGRSAQYDYLKVYASIVIISIITTGLRSEWAVTGGVRAARRSFAAMLNRVLFAPMNYFETTPMGRILNRFTYDVEVVDILLTQSMSMLMIASSWFIAGIVVLATIIPFLVVALVPVLVAYGVTLTEYRKSGTDLQRLDALSRSPLQAMLTEVLEGSSSIRVFGRERIFVQRFRQATNTNSGALLNFITAQRWLGVRIEILGTCVILAAGVLVVCLNDRLQIPAGIAGLMIVWAVNFTLSLGFWVDFFGEAEAAITAIERIDSMTRIPNEKAMETEPKYLPPSNWPASGEIEFDKVCMRYRDGLPLVLKNLSFTIPAGKRCGVVGRSGAGKSSLTVALFRLVEIESGRISLDGQELGCLGLSDVRGRRQGMAIIPQDPFLTGSTLRECVDPFGESEDVQVLDALRSVRMADSNDSIEKLNTVVEEGGSNYSVGERQLLNLARALLSQPKVLVLDEATASVDGETDAFIQQMLRTRFQGTTLLTIAHRLNTITDYDLVLVIADGSAAEFGSPSELLDNNGKFAQLVDSTGTASAKALRQAINQSLSE